MSPVRVVAVLLMCGAPTALARAADAAVECRCVYGGRYYDAGDVACIPTAEGPRLATCGRVANLSSWRFTERACGPVSRGRVPRRSQTAKLAPRAD